MSRGTDLPTRLARVVGGATRDVAMALRMSGRDTSLNADLTEGSDYTLLETLADDRESQEDALARREEENGNREAVKRALDLLNDREQRIIRERILADDPRTLQEIADELGISRERVRQLEQNALRRIRQNLEPPAGLESLSAP